MQTHDPKTGRPLLKKQLRFLERQQRELRKTHNPDRVAAILGTCHSAHYSSDEGLGSLGIDACLNLDLRGLVLPEDWLFDGDHTETMGV